MWIILSNQVLISGKRNSCCGFQMFVLFYVLNNIAILFDYFQEKALQPISLKLGSSHQNNVKKQKTLHVSVFDFGVNCYFKFSSIKYLIHSSQFIFHVNLINPTFVKHFVKWEDF